MKMTPLVLVLCGVLNLAIILLVLLNRSSEKIVTSYTSITIGALAAIALAVAAFADQGAISQRFPVAFFIDPADLRQIYISSRVDMYFGQGAELHAAALRGSADEFGLKAYHRALQRVLIEWMNRTYFNSWRVESVHYDTPGPWELRVGPIEGADDPSTIIAMEDVRALFSASPPEPFFEKVNRIALPPGLFGRRAELRVVDVHHDKAFGDTGEISIHNDFCDLRLATRTLGGHQGLGEYGSLAGISEAQDQLYAHNLYEVIAKVTFTSWLGGHPEMPKYRRWATSLIEMMRDTFDEQRILQRSRDAAAHPNSHFAKGRRQMPAIAKFAPFKKNP